MTFELQEDAERVMEVLKNRIFFVLSTVFVYRSFYGMRKVVS